MKHVIRKIQPDDPGYGTPEAERCPWLLLADDGPYRGLVFTSHEAAMRCAGKNTPEDVVRFLSRNRTESR